MSKVTDITGRLERWAEAHRTPDLTIKVSTHGRLMLSLDDRVHILSFVHALSALQGITREYRKAGFAGPDSDPTPGSSGAANQ